MVYRITFKTSGGTVKTSKAPTKRLISSVERGIKMGGGKVLSINKIKKEK